MPGRCAARSARPASVTLSRTAPVIGAPILPRPPRPGRTAGRGAGTLWGMHARLSGARQAGTRRQRGPSAAVRGKSTVTPTVLTARTPSAICPWTPQHRGLNRPKVTHHGTEKNGSRSRQFAASGPFSQGVAGGGFEPPRAKPTVLQPAPSIRVMPLTCAYAIRDGIAGHRRPLCVRTSRARGRCDARTGTDGGGGSGMPAARRSGIPTVLSGLRLLTCTFRTPARCRRFFPRQAALGLGDAESVGDAVVGGIG